MPAPGTNGSTAITSTSTSEPTSTTVIGRSRSVRSTCAAARVAPAQRARGSRLNDETMVGSVLSSVMKPPAATAPAPIWRT